MATKHPTLYTKQQCASIEIICVCVWSHHQSYLTDPVWGGKGIDSFQKTQLLYSPGGRHGNDVTHWNTWRDLKTSAPCSPPRHNSLRLGVLAENPPEDQSETPHCVPLVSLGLVIPDYSTVQQTCHAPVKKRLKSVFQFLTPEICLHFLFWKEDRFSLVNAHLVLALEKR